MAKGQIHMGKNGPEKCSADSSNPRSTGCHYQDTGHYDSVDEAMDSYATLNKVNSSELKELVADGATPKDAVGLIWSGYGKDYLDSAKRDSVKKILEARELEDVSSNYLEAKTQVLIELDDVAPGVTVEGTESAQGIFGVIIRKSARPGFDGYSYVVVSEGNAISFEKISVGPNTAEADAVGAKLQSAMKDKKSLLRRDLTQMLSSYKQMTSQEIAQGS